MLESRSVRRGLLPGIVITVAVLADATAQTPATGRGSPVNCGQDLDCLIRHAQSCTPARVVRTDDTDFLGLQQKSTTQYELGGLRAGACRFTQRALDVRVKFNEDLRQTLRKDGKTDADIAELERTWFAKLRAEGKDRQTCDFPPKRLLEILTALRQGALLIGGSEDAQYCPALAAETSVGPPVSGSGSPGGAARSSARIHLKSGSSFDVPRWWYKGDLLYYERFGGVISVPRSEVDRIEN
ncbi:MAG: hypothetical protein ACRELA_18150 [Candidatus Rokuibacteriota bacterium]